MAACRRRQVSNGAYGTVRREKMFTISRKMHFNLSLKVLVTKRFRNQAYAQRSTYQVAFSSDKGAAIFKLLVYLTPAQI